jgi:MFS family permease
VVWLLMLDQLVFVLSDYATGLASDRVARVVGRLGAAVLGVTLLSCAAFLALPFVAPGGSPGLFIAVTLLWSVSSSALRAPPLTLVGRYAARPSQPGLVSLSLLGLGLASALAPYLTLQLRGLDPRWPFVLSSAALAAATLGIVAMERSLASSSHEPSVESARPPPQEQRPSAGFLIAALGVALAFQAHANLNSSALYLRLAPASELPRLMPVFWIGFNLMLLPAGAAAKRWGALPLMGAAGVVAALAAIGAQQAASLALLVALQLIAGAAWAAVLMSAFAAALELGHTGREGRLAGALSSLLALAALARLSLVAVAAPQRADVQAALGWVPGLLWLAGGLCLLLRSRQRH